MSATPHARPAQGPARQDPAIRRRTARYRGALLGSAVLALVVPLGAGAVANAGTASSSGPLVVCLAPHPAGDGQEDAWRFMEGSGGAAPDPGRAAVPSGTVETVSSGPVVRLVPIAFPCVRQGAAATVPDAETGPAPAAEPLLRA